ncbi:hypothetical protein C1645_800975 [Glomus cerebriforme]|uniref:DUF7431 domain-containing protein n=1 Tax=Glomus cerebriforme TaxID=658196 RepID=A0A397TLB8_9GLOM|nr:hypothetical protein C1645_800975 [Glomus cerebriforme]
MADFDNVAITIIQIDDEPSQPIKPIKQSITVSLCCKDNLSTIRENLKIKNEMDDTLSFAIKISQNNTTSKILRDDEDNYTLNKIIYNERFIYITKNSNPDWKYLKNKHKLDYGRIAKLNEFKVAEKQAFIMRNCEIEEFGNNGLKYGRTNFNSSEDKIMKTNLFLTAEVEKDFAKLGISFRKSNNEEVKSEINSRYVFKEMKKVSLKFRSEYLEPTEDFDKEVRDAIESENPRKFKEITKKYGQFVLTKVDLGGKVCFEGTKTLNKYSKENTNTYSAALPLKAKIEHTTIKSNENNSCSEEEFFKLIGGKGVDNIKTFQEFDEKVWAKSLKDFRDWDCVKYEKPISIFQPLCDELRKKIYKLIGKKILHFETKEFNYESGSPGIFELNMPSNISEILQNKEAECNIFATVIDTEGKKGDIFSCQIHYPSDDKDDNENPRLTIHCIQGSAGKRKYKLKISWLIVGYDINFTFILSDFNIQLNVLENKFDASTMTSSTNILDFEHDSDILCFGIPVLGKFCFSNKSLVIGHHFFNVQEGNKIGTYAFSYSLKDKHYVNLPTFTLYILVISNFPTSGAYGKSHFNCTSKADNIKKAAKKAANQIPELLKLAKLDSKSLNPRFISLYSKGKDDCSPIFPQQKFGEVRKRCIKSIKSCKHDDCTCKNENMKKSENNLEYVFFDPNQGIATVTRL